MSLTCDICGATAGKNGKPFANQGALNMHKVHCRYQHQDEKGGTHVKLGNPDNKNKCDHEWRLLNASDPIEKHAILEQWKEVCTKCSELR